MFGWVSNTVDLKSFLQNQFKCKIGLMSTKQISNFYLLYTDWGKCQNCWKLWFFCEAKSEAQASTTRGQQCNMLDWPFLTCQENLFSAWSRNAWFSDSYQEDTTRYTQHMDQKLFSRPFCLFALLCTTNTRPRQKM